MPGVAIRVRLTPRGGGDGVIGMRGGVLHLRVVAPPVDGAANRACAALVADLFGLRRAQVTLVAGAAGRDKRFALADVTPEAVAERLAALPALGD